MLVILLETQYCYCDSFWTMFYSWVARQSSCGAFASYTNSGDSLLVFFWLLNNPRLPAVLRGWCKGWKIIRRQEEDTRKEKPTTKFKTTYQTWASQWFNTDWNDSKSRDQSLSLDQVSSVPLMQTRAKVSIKIMADQFALEHMWLSLLYTMRQQEETRMYCKKIEYPNHTTRMYCKKNKIV
jgi:hypothetical protein